MANEKFVASLSSLEDLLSSGNGYMFVVTGKKSDSIRPGTTGDQIGNYDQDGLGTYVASAFYNTTMQGYECFLFQPGQRPLPVTMYFASAPTPGKYDNVTRFKEDPDDDGVSFQNSTTWYKYDLGA